MLTVNKKYLVSWIALDKSVSFEESIHTYFGYDNDCQKYIQKYIQSTCACTEGK